MWIRFVPGQADHEEARRNPYGKRQGAPEEWVCVVRPGKILFEMEGVTKDIAAAAMKLAAASADMRNKLITRER